MKDALIASQTSDDAGVTQTSSSVIKSLHPSSTLLWAYSAKKDKIKLKEISHALAIQHIIGFLD